MSSSSVEIESNLSNEDALRHAYYRSGNQFTLSNQFYKSLVASAFLSKTVVKHGRKFENDPRSFRINFNVLDAALKGKKDIKGLASSSMRGFLQNLSINKNDQDEVSSKLLAMPTT